MFVRTVDDKPSDTLVVVSGEGSWTGSSTLPHLHHFLITKPGPMAGLFAVASALKGPRHCNRGRRKIGGRRATAKA
jgi:hypothetical protein